jgi:DNA-binding MarR family transcriptional regulator
MNTRSRGDDDGLLDAVRIVMRLARIIERCCDDVGLTMPQYRALNHAARGKRRSYELARFSAVSRAAMSALTTGMLKAGLLERNDAEGDGRGVEFGATRHGLDVLAALEDRLVARFVEVLGPAAASLKTLDVEAIEAALDREVDREFGPLYPSR